MPDTENVTPIRPTEEAFCDCTSCGKPILVGQIMMTISYGREIILSANEVQPCDQQTAHTFCEGCADEFDYESISLSKKSD